MSGAKHVHVSSMKQQIRNITVIVRWETTVNFCYTKQDDLLTLKLFCCVCYFLRLFMGRCNIKFKAKHI